MSTDFPKIRPENGLGLASMVGESLQNVRLAHDRNSELGMMVIR